jgi:hypothetical protein
MWPTPYLQALFRDSLAEWRTLSFADLRFLHRTEAELMLTGSSPCRPFC